MCRVKKTLRVTDGEDETSRDRKYGGSRRRSRATKRTMRGVGGSASNKRREEGKGRSGTVNPQS